MYANHMNVSDPDFHPRAARGYVEEFLLDEHGG